MPRFAAHRSRNRWPYFFGRFSVPHFPKINNKKPCRFPIFFTLGLGLLVFVVMFIKVIVQGYTQAVWKGEGQVTFVFEQNNKVGYIKINTDLNEAVVLTFPDNTLIALSNGYQEYQASKVKLLANQEKTHFGELLTRSMTQFLGSVTDGYIINGQGDYVDISTLLIQAIFRRAETNFSDWDLLRLILFTANLRNNHIRTIDMPTTSVFELTTLPDKSQVYEIKPEELDAFGLKELARPKYLKEQLTWEIFNGTQHTGLGSMMKRMVANSGFDVTGVRQARKPYETSAIIVTDKASNNPYVTDFARYFHLPVTTEGDKSDIADVTVILGEDFWESCCVRKKE